MKFPYCARTGLATRGSALAPAPAPVPAGRIAAAVGLALGLAMAAGTAAASVVYTYTSNSPFTFKFETASALASGAETRLVAIGDLATPTPNILSWSFSVGATSFDSNSAGASLLPLYVLLAGNGDLARICGGGSLAGSAWFSMNNAATPGGMLSGTSCANMYDNFDSYEVSGGSSGFIRGLGSWTVQEVTTAPPNGNNLPEPGSLALVAAALLALRLRRQAALRP